MLTSDSRRQRWKILLATLVLLSATAWLFYQLQNQPGRAGGSLAPVKALWLLNVIVFWYALPLFWATDRSVSRKGRLACWILAINMLLRGMVELGLMYLTNTWQHSYGVGHDIFSIMLCVVLVTWVRSDERWLPALFSYCAVLFAFEAYFALYLRHASGADGTVFFLANSDAHSRILLTTGAIVALSAIVATCLFWKWMNAEPTRPGSNH